MNYEDFGKKVLKEINKQVLNNRIDPTDIFKKRYKKRFSADLVSKTGLTKDIKERLYICDYMYNMSDTQINLYNIYLQIKNHSLSKQQGIDLAVDTAEKKIQELIVLAQHYLDRRLAEEEFNKEHGIDTDYTRCGRNYIGIESTPRKEKDGLPEIYTYTPLSIHNFKWDKVFIKDIYELLPWINVVTISILGSYLCITNDIVSTFWAIIISIVTSFILLYLHNVSFIRRIVIWCFGIFDTTGIFIGLCKLIELVGKSKQYNMLNILPRFVVIIILLGLGVLGFIISDKITYKYRLTKDEQGFGMATLCKIESALYHGVYPLTTPDYNSASKFCIYIEKICYKYRIEFEEERWMDGYNINKKIIMKRELESSDK